MEVTEPWACRSCTRDAVAGCTFQDLPLAVAGLQGRQSRTSPWCGWEAAQSLAHGTGGQAGMEAPTQPPVLGI